MAGLTLGGGYGPLTPRCGLALDNLLGAEVVLADGRRIMADPLEHPDLFWALRGGGGNFGVVTAMRVRLHSISDVIAGLIVYPWSDAASVLRGYADMAVSFPDELTVLLGVLSGPDGRPVLFLAPTWSGSQSQGELVIAKLEGLGTPLQAHIDVMTCGDAVGRFDAHSVSGRHCALETRWLPALTPHVISALIAAGETITSPYSAIVLQHFRGAPTRIPSGVTAFAMRREHFLLEVVAMWEAGPADDFSSAMGARGRRSLRAQCFAGRLSKSSRSGRTRSDCGGLWQQSHSAAGCEAALRSRLRVHLRHSALRRTFALGAPPTVGSAGLILLNLLSSTACAAHRAWRPTR